MPKEYEAMRDSMAKRMDYDKAQAIAAATYNKRHPGKPMGRHHKALVEHMGKKT